MGENTEIPVEMLELDEQVKHYKARTQQLEVENSQLRQKVIHLELQLEWSEHEFINTTLRGGD